MVDNISKKLMNIVKSVVLKVFIFFFRGLLHFKKMFMLIFLKYNRPLKENLQNFRSTS